MAAGKISDGLMTQPSPLPTWRRSHNDADAMLYRANGELASITRLAAGLCNAGPSVVWSRPGLDRPGQFGPVVGRQMSRRAVVNSTRRSRRLDRAGAYKFAHLRRPHAAPARPPALPAVHPPPAHFYSSGQRAMCA